MGDTYNIVVRLCLYDLFRNLRWDKSIYIHTYIEKDKSWTVAQNTRPVHHGQTDRGITAYHTHTDSVLTETEAWTMPRGRFVVASCGVLSEGYGHDGPGVCLGDGQTESYLRDMGMTDLPSAWAMARRSPI